MTANSPAIRPLPFRVRPFPLETPQSYSRRLFEANGIPREVWKVLVYTRARDCSISRDLALASVLEESGDLRRDHFAHQRTLLPHHTDGTSCKRCVTGLSDRSACTLCSAGCVVEQYEHDGPRVCERHLRWIGPGTSHDEQYSVSQEVLRADQRYQELLAHGRIDALRLTEIQESVTMWALGELGSQLRPDERFRISVAVAVALLAPPTAVGSNRATDWYERLSRDIGEAVGHRSTVILTDLVWLLRRGGSSDDPHAFGGPRSVAAEAEHLEQLRTCFYPRELHLHVTQFVRSRMGKSRLSELTATNSESEYRCARGHTFVASPGRLRRTSLRAGIGGCSYCSNRLPLAGFNTLADVRPDIAGEWHPTDNGDLRADQVLAGSARRVVWLCPDGHRYEAPIVARAMGGCPVCSNRIVVAGLNSLSTTRPDIAASWHPTRNLPLTSDDVVAGSYRKVWWICPEGHEYRLIVQRRSQGRGCHYCVRQKVHPTTCLAVTHPDLAKEWHPTLNGTVTPHDVLYGTQKKAWWLCENGHAFDAVVASRVLGNGCRYCDGRVATADNNMTITHPAIAREFHPTKNGSKRASDYLTGTSVRLWWLCSRGHEWQTTGETRLGGAGCRYCAGRSAWPGWNDLASQEPSIAAEWHPTRNGTLTPVDVTRGSGRSVWWQCSEGHEWQMVVHVRTYNRRGCSRCAREERAA